jgi:hypothetical protein
MFSCNLKRYEHEESPQDEMFRGVKSYQEVLSRVRALPPSEMVEFYNFQKHRRSGLPKVLQRENPKSLATQQTETQNPQAKSSTKNEALENLEKYEVSTQKKDIPATEVSDDQSKYQSETLKNQGKDKP